MFRLVSESRKVEEADADVSSAKLAMNRTTKHVVLGYVWVKRLDSSNKPRTDIVKRGIYLYDTKAADKAEREAAEAKAALEKDSTNAQKKEENEYRQKLAKIEKEKLETTIIGTVLITTETDWLVYVREGASVQIDDSPKDVTFF